MIGLKYKALAFGQIKRELTQSIPSEWVRTASNEFRYTGNCCEIIKSSPKFSCAVRSKLPLGACSLFAELPELLIVEVDIQSITQCYSNLPIR